MDEGKNSILIVEDEMILAMNTRHTLEEAGYRVTGIAITGEEALLMAEELGIPVIYLTGNSDEGTLERARRTNPAGILQKPTEDYRLSSVINKILGS
jgi:CheY-like chemotaxis protein